VVRPYDLGVLGERLAEQHLRKLGYRVLERNFRHGRNEIDLIVRCGTVVAFVEVKTRATDRYGHPLEAVTALKRREVERVARYWRRQHSQPGLSYRFDAIGIVVRPGKVPSIEHIPNAWRLGE
jgi:putative endonuclease